MTLPARAANGCSACILAYRGPCFLFGLYRRQMKAIGQIGALDGRFGVPVTTRSWSTITTIAATCYRRGRGSPFRMATRPPWLFVHVAE